jgi:hypothetical protein
MSTEEKFFLSIDRALTARDSKQNIPFHFQVPPGMTHLSFHFAYQPKTVDDILNLLTLTVFDPSGWRGEGHRHDAPYEITIGTNRASPGFRPGPILPGEWTVVVNTHMVMPGEPCTLHLTIRGAAQPAGDLSRLAAGQTASRGPGWYRGDLHAHSLHSDAEWDVAGLVADARQRGLDFVTLSDHNTVSGLAELDAARADDLLTIDGVELTTFWGHALVLGLRDWVDWRCADGQAGQPGLCGMDQIYYAVTGRGALFIIAHPMAQGDPYCTGCDWRYAEVHPGPAQVVEVWNDDWNSVSNNEDGFRLACDWLNQGHRLAFTSGTDNHGHPGEPHYGYDVVYADDLSEQAILKAVRAGHLFLSAGPWLEWTAENGQQRAMMGDALDAGSDTPIQLTLRWSGCPPGAQLEWIVDGQLREHLVVTDQGSKSWILPAGSARWSLVTLRDPQGRMLALTNPIYFP